jgi:diguanylate cyclase (GGDEF)-like protein
MLSPSCPSCGCPLRACEADAFPRIAATLEDQRVAPRRARMDGAGPLAVMTAGPFVLPLIGVEIRDVIFAVPLLFLVFACALSFAASRREGEPRLPWLAYGASAGLGVAATVAGIVLHVAGSDLRLPSHLAALASLALLAGLVAHLRPRLRHARTERLLDAAQMQVLAVAAAVFFVLVPALREGDTLLTLVFAASLVAFVTAGFLAVAGRRRQDLLVGRRLWMATLFIVVAHGLMAADAAALLAADEAIAAALYAVAGWFLAGAAVAERPAPTPQDVAGPAPGAERRWVAARVVLPTLHVAAFPVAVALALRVSGDDTWPLAWFGGAFVLMLLLAFGRQAHLVIDHQRAVVEERRARRKAQRRNEELEALTGLAATMTQTLEEAPIVEQALTVLHTAARATSSALHVSEDGRRRLRASAGNWQAEHPWADRQSPDDPELVRHERGGHQVTRLQLRAREREIGSVTFVRAVEDPMTDREIELLRLLVDQMAVAIQNARDYREKLEQAIRDPLTGLYNRRFFWEALEKETQRAGRYGSQAALVLFDVDDFKKINDAHGHGVGDQVLRGIAGAVMPLLRPVDSLARIGGEEFAVLLPETSQFDALLVAERMRAAISRPELAPGVRVTVSAGVGACPQDAESRDELVRRTDSALYWAKRNGKDLCAVVNETTDEITERAADAGAAVAHLTHLVAGLDPDGHGQAVAAYAVALGEALGFKAQQLSRLRRAAVLHDVGMVAVDAEILAKPAHLTDAEYAEVKLHSNVGAAMLRHAGLTEEAAWVRHHHERFDGRGYPAGLEAGNIPIEARVLFIADAFAAMTSDRPHRAALSAAQALAELTTGAGSQFDPRLVRMFCKLVQRGGLEVQPTA